MNKSLISALVLLGVASVFLYNLDTNVQSTGFQQFKKDFAKKYTKQGEEQYRKGIFFRNVAKIQAHNADPTVTYLKGINQFTDLTDAEFESIYLTLKVPAKPIETIAHTPIVGDVDWTTSGKVTGVKNQGQCGSCWAFSAVAAIESAILVANKPEALYSEQQLVDCSGEFGNHGCQGGWMDSAFQYVAKYGLNLQRDYPYVARNQACAKKGGDFKISGFVDVNGCNNLLTALQARPISVAVDASVWSPYKSGILSSCGTNVNHGVLLVGANDNNWKIKNSWGTTWGESGYIRLAQGNTCAVCSYPSYPTL